MSSEMLAARELNKVALCEILNRYIHCNLTDLDLVELEPDSSILDLMVIKIIRQSLSSGDPRYLTFILDRLLGPISQQMHVTGNVHGDLMKVLGHFEDQD